jgi:hypothetical protein
MQLVLNATEAHEQTFFVTPGHVVFRNEGGRISWIDKVEKKRRIRNDKSRN